jgi:hypothetical protein
LKFRALSEEGGRVKQVTLTELVQVSDKSIQPRLWLPPIQRSLVWTNIQLIAFWDSIFRGYPLGTMMVHAPSNEVSDGLAVGVSDHEPETPGPDDLLLFDGQQRLHAIRLGFGKVDNATRKLWLDIGDTSNSSSDAWIVPLRISSPGQPFGYKLAEPNSKYDLGKRRDHFDHEVKINGFEKTASRAHFWESDGVRLIGASHAVPLSWFLREDERLKDLTAFAKRIGELKALVSEAKTRTIALLSVPTEVTGKPSDYKRFFERIGRGGTALSDKELAYSIVKQRFPEVRAQMEKLVNDPEVGHLADEVDLVLGCYRVAQTLGFVDTPDRLNESWRRVRYPRSEDLDRFDRLSVSPETNYFKSLLLDPDRERLKPLLRAIRVALTDGENYLPRMLLPYVHAELWHVLLVWGAANRWDTDDKAMLDHSEAIRAFVLWWMLFVTDDVKAAQLCFERSLQCEPHSTDEMRNLVENLHENGAARRVLTGDKICKVYNALTKSSKLRAWGNRFHCEDCDSVDQESLWLWANDPRIRQRALIWLQRENLAYWPETQGFDPTSSLDDDLPFDFDHLVPQVRWGADWRNVSKQLHGLNEDAKEFRNHRWVVGNSIGNFRILTVSENRRRQASCLTDADRNTAPEIASDLELWCQITTESKLASGEAGWDADDVADFQYLIEKRTIALYHKVVQSSGISELIHAREPRDHVTS